jgi:hypothetical protein
MSDAIRSPDDLSSAVQRFTAAEETQVDYPPVRKFWR